MKKLYESPELEFVKFSFDDVLAIENSDPENTGSNTDDNDNRDDLGG